MAKKFMHIRRVIIPVLVLVAMLAQATPAFAVSAEEFTELSQQVQQVEVMAYDNPAVPLIVAGASVTAPVTLDTIRQKFPDIPESMISWAGEALVYNYNHGYMEGKSVAGGQTKMAPEAKLTLGEFVTMLSRVFLSQERRDSLDQTLVNLGETLDHNDHWAAKYFYYANQTNITFGVSTDFENWDKPVSRANMAVLIDNVMNMQGQATPNTNYVYTKIPDWHKIQGTVQSSSILRVYADGVVIGVNQAGDFNPDGTVTRAVAAIIAMRIQEPSTRQPISTSTNGSGSTNNSDNPDLAAPQTIHEGQGAVGRNPQPGDTWVSASGDEVVLAIDPLTGVLGWGQFDGYMDYWTGTPSATGDAKLVEGYQVIHTQNGKDHSGMLMKGDKGMFTRGQWDAIADATKPTYQGKTKGELDSTGLWKWYPTANQWAWIGE